MAAKYIHPEEYYISSSFNIKVTKPQSHLTYTLLFTMRARKCRDYHLLCTKWMDSTAQVFFQANMKDTYIGLLLPLGIK